MAGASGQVTCNNGWLAWARLRRGLWLPPQPIVGARSRGGYAKANSVDFFSRSWSSNNDDKDQWQGQRRRRWDFWGGSNTTISISHGERWHLTKTAMSNKNERRSKRTTSNDQRRDLGKGGNIRIQKSALIHRLWVRRCRPSSPLKSNVNDDIKQRQHRPRLGRGGQFKNTTINIIPSVVSSAGSQRTMATTSNDDVQRQGGNFKYNNLHDNKDEQLDNNERW